MRCLNKLLVPLAFLMLFSNGVAAASEPSKCWALAGELDSGLTVGMGMKLCSGTTDGAATIQCFTEAFGHPDNGGFGLNMGLAVNLCKSNSEPF
jgi:hypothetical protein